MKAKAGAFLVAATLATAAAARHHHESDDPTNWHAVATDADKDRLRRWRVAFVQAIAETSPDHARELAAAGALLQPDAARGAPTPPPGAFRCRTIKLGAQVKGRETFLAYPPQPCAVARDGDGSLAFSVGGGAQRPQGTLLPDGDMRMVFVGTMMLGDETTPLAYGRDSERDLIGAWERLGPRQWRLVLPFPHWQSTLDVIEVTPAD